MGDLRITSATSLHLPGSGNYFRDGPGETMGVSVTTTASATASASVSVDQIVVEAKVEVSVTVSKSMAVTKGHKYTQPIRAGYYGNMQYGSWGYSLAWQRIKVNTQCGTTVVESGTAKVPSSAEGWRFWETK